MFQTGHKPSIPIFNGHNTELMMHGSFVEKQECRGFVGTLYGKLKSVNVTRLIQKGAVCSCDSWMDGLITYPQM
jgi:hypothetical protein